MGDYLFRKTLQKLNHHLLSLEWILNVIFIDEREVVEQATSTKKSVCWWWFQSWYKSHLLHAINFWSYREVRSGAETSPTETLGGWGTLHPSKQLTLPRGQHHQYPIHYKEQRKKKGGKQGRERNNKHLFTVTVVIFAAIFFMIYDWLRERLEVNWLGQVNWLRCGSCSEVAFGNNQNIGGNKRARSNFHHNDKKVKSHFVTSL